MSGENHKVIVRRIHEELNHGNLGILDELYAPDYVSHVGDRTSGLREYREHLQTHRTAFPDWHSTIEEILVDGDMVVTRITDRGTHEGPWSHRYLGSIAPTGKTVNSTRMIIRRLKDGKVVETWVNADHLGMLHQLGAIGPPAKPAR